MSPLTILIVRHAEKPDDPDLGPGMSLYGDPDDRSLVVRGWQRAGAWAALFGSGTMGSDHPRPDVVYAANPEEDANGNACVSRHPFETVIPLCERLDIAAATYFGVGDEAALLSEIRDLTGVVLICWEHKKITSALLPGLADGQTIPRLPTKWDSARFDVVLRFDRAVGGGGWSFRQLFPRLLSLDQDVPLGDHGDD